MTNEQKYAEVLKALGEVIAEKELTISIKNHHIQELENKLKIAEAERDMARAERDNACGECVMTALNITPPTIETEEKEVNANA